MCFGGSQPQAPQVQYVGPSDDDIRRNEQALAQYQEQITTQQNTFQTQLQSQIDAANAETEQLRADYAADLTAAKAAGAAGVANAEAAGAAALSEAGAAAAAQQVGAYTVSATQSEPEMAQTTTTIKEKKKPKKDLKISTAGAMNSAGSGVNLGI